MSSVTFYNPSGWLQYTSPQSQAFLANQTVTMNISVSNNNHDQFSITSLGLAWYHNGSRIEGNDRIDISNNQTTLTISNTKDSDAGKYEVRIDSLTFGNHSSPECNQLLLPILENFALHTPATFLLQQNALPRYSPEDIINNYFIPQYMDGDLQRFTTTYTGAINSTLYRNTLVDFFAFKDGQHYESGSRPSIHNVGMNIYNFTYFFDYRNSQNAIGHYVGLHYIHYDYSMQSLCPIYYNHLVLHFRYIPFHIQYWTISIERKF